MGDIDLPTEVAKALEMNPPTREDIDMIGTLAEDEANGYFIDSAGCKYSRTDGRPLKPEEAPTGGVCTCAITGVPVGIGEPCFDKLEAELAKAMMSLPAVKAFEVGEGFNCCRMRGSDHNDLFVGAGHGLLDCKTNHAGGTLGGISTGLPLIMRMGIKPASSISRDQETCTFDGEKHVLQVKGRHDPCVLPRVPPLVEGMGALAVADACMRQRVRQGRQLHTLNEHAEERPAKVARISSA